MEKIIFDYKGPEIEIIEILVEKGFASSNGDGNGDENADGTGAEAGGDGWG